jgi:beta-glucosidase
MLSINMDDVINVLKSIQNYLIGFAVVAVLLIIAIIASGKIASKKTKILVRGEAALAIVLALVITVNLICFGPMSTMLDLVSGGGTIDEATSAEATQLVTEIAEEGIVLLENDGLLPLTGTTNLNVFGWASTNPCYGGTGSGALNDAYPTVTLLEGLEEAGFTLNTELSDFYTSYKSDRPTVGMWAQDWTLPEPNVSLYTDSMMSNAKDFSDTALIVITRVGGEGADLPTDMTAVTYDDSLNSGTDWDSGDTYLNLTNREEEMVDLVCSNFDKVFVVYNGANAMELGFLQEYSQIKAAIWCPGTGQSGFTALGEIIAGTVNPSGKTTDTFVYDLTATPYFNNIGSFIYDNMNEFLYETTNRATGDPETVYPNFVNYVEGIYVGYRFYETADVEGLINYNKTVQYPFGYGMSYTTFTQKMENFKDSGDSVSFDVTVTNTGSVAGKDVVEVYYTAPYTNGGIEKAAVNLVEYGKTQMLSAGASETLSFTIAKEDFASYDSDQIKVKGGGYILEAGEYTISIRSDSHTVLDEATFTVASDIDYSVNGRDSDNAVAVNQFDYAKGNATYLSRANGFANYAAATAAPTNFTMDAESKATFYNISNYLTAEATAADEDPDAQPITTGSGGKIQLKELRGLDYDDPTWDSLLDQLTLDEMNSVISLGGYQTAAIDSIGKVRTNDNDGPASINNNFTGVGSIGFPSAVMIAATWNNELAYAFGDSIGQMGDQMDTSGWYGPAMNIHRSAFAGRNFEYYSEDGFLSGRIAANAIEGAQAQGMYAYMKHFALNDQETNRNKMICTWSTEQAMREIYFKPFEMSVKEADCKAVMSSFNYIGNRWAGGSASLCQTVLRDEWGFQGFVETDYFGVYGYMSSDQAIRNGTDLMLVNYATATNDVQFRETAGAQQAMRTATKNILYVVVNSRAYTEANLNPGMPTWEKIAIAADVVLAVAIAFGAFTIYKKSRNVSEVL